ncbi:MAG: hypothetical protein LBB94_02870 [Clostridiales bacterium]|nr:hypothetical protein [Clostridiales bacterium]
MTLTDTARKLTLNIALHFFIALAIGLALNAAFHFDTQPAFILGLGLGAAVSAVKVVLMERGISKSLSMASSYAGLYAILQITLRNILSAALLTYAALNVSVSVWGVIAGLALLQSGAFSLRAR